MRKRSPRSLGTHDGSFHADEVSACALLIVFDQIDREKIVRTRDPALLETCEYVCDVGGVYDPQKKRFDHHQNEYTGSLSSAGMVWLYLRSEKKIDPLLYEYLNKRVIIGVDAHDNGKELQEEGVCTFSHLISYYVPLKQAAGIPEIEKGFFAALDFAIDVFTRLIKRFEYVQSCKAIVQKTMARGEKVLVFEEAIPWQDSFFDLGGETHPALFLIMPAGSHWKLRAIPPSRHKLMEVRCPLPSKWAGLRDEELQQITGIPGAIFCHKGRFISIWETKEDARKAADLVLSIPS